MICSKRLQRNSIRIPIEESYLVLIIAVHPSTAMFITPEWNSKSGKGGDGLLARRRGKRPNAEVSLKQAI